ncbi:Prefoldin subunit-domain-containing protein [Phyllosticta paracitricarpa]|uniref:Prefoldin subunit-domain-containing protein n=1 Tax=Phyllosticta paracitricarpa TaxID=2016321 RepID=A0ABR1MSW5_9PEZI
MASSSEKGGQTVDLASLSVQQLSQLKKQLDTELEHLTGSFQSLRGAQTRFRDCLKSINTGVSSGSTGTPLAHRYAPAIHTPPTSPQYLPSCRATFPRCLGTHKTLTSASTVFTDKPILVPLTSSLYVPGTLANLSSVLVDIGTGFYVEKSTADAADFYDRKIKDLEKNLKDLEAIVTGKSGNLRVVEDVLRQKVLAAQGQAGAQAAVAGSQATAAAS